MNSRKKNISIILGVMALVITALLGLKVSTQLFAILPVWFALSIVTYYLSSELASKKIILLMFTYPFIELMIKLWIVLNIVPMSWVYLNRLEHFLGALFITILLKQLFILLFNNQPKPVLLLLLFLAVITLGLFNEIFEYYLRTTFNAELPSTPFERYISGENGSALGWIYYYDTISDMIINIAGAAIGIILLEKQSVFETLRKGLKRD